MLFYELHETSNMSLMITVLLTISYFSLLLCCFSVLQTMLVSTVMLLQYTLLPLLSILFS